MLCESCGIELEEESKFCFKCGNKLEGENLGKARERINGNKWCYLINGEVKEVTSKEELIKLYKEDKILNETKIWGDGIEEWTELYKSGILEKNSCPPPVKGNDINNTYVWILAFAPVIGTILEGVAFEALGYSENYWIITVILNIGLCVLDEKNLKKSGYSENSLLGWAIFVVPVYLFKRAVLLNQKKAYVVVWCLSFLASLL